MDFKIRIHQHTVYEYLINAREIGIKDVDAIRAKLAQPNLPLKVICENTEVFARGDITQFINISEDIARESNLFAEKSTVLVKVSDEKLLEFVHPDLCVDVADTGEITSVVIIHVFQ